MDWLGMAAAVSSEEGVVFYEIVMDGGESIRVQCERVDVGMHRGEIISMRVWPPEGGAPYYMRLPPQAGIAFLRAVGPDWQESEHGTVRATGAHSGANYG
jgi:hypothetical protein